MSKLFVDEIVHQSSQGSGTITLGASGETISVPSGATLTVPNGGLSGQNYPAFEAYLSANQSISDSTATKVQFNTERFDTDSCYDNATNYRFTPTVAGKLASGVLPNNTPAFESYLSANQSISDSTATKVQFNTERFDTDSCYDNATNYRFTPTVAGKYFVYANVVFQLDDYQIYQGVIYFYKNGSNYHSFGTVDGAGSAFGFPISTSAIIDMNGTTDYIEVFGQVIRHSSTGNRFGTEYRGTYFGAYKIIE